MLTVSQEKNERLINLLIFLLTARKDRFWKKSEIFDRVQGYNDGESNAIAMDRKFERDKVELRNLGIVIDVQEIDPLFEDEIGYRVSPEKYSTKLTALTPQEISLLAMAGKMWRDVVSSDEVQSTLLRLHSLNSDMAISPITSQSPVPGNQEANFATVATALAHRRAIEFTYLNSDLSQSTRRVHPFALLARHGYWYLIGEEVASSEKRTFRLDRVVGDPLCVGKESAFEIPKGVKSNTYFEHEEGVGESVLLKCAKGRAHSFAAIAEDVESFEDYDLINILVTDPRELIDQILCHGEDVTVLEPESLRHEIKEILSKLVKSYG